MSPSRPSTSSVDEFTVSEADVVPAEIKQDLGLPLRSLNPGIGRGQDGESQILTFFTPIVKSRISVSNIDIEYLIEYQRSQPFDSKFDISSETITHATPLSSSLLAPQRGISGRYWNVGPLICTFKQKLLNSPPAIVRKK